MGASAYIGRVGGLAVALGVGVAIASGTGTAWATDTESATSTSEQAPSESGETGSAITPTQSPLQASADDEQSDVDLDEPLDDPVDETEEIEDVAVDSTDLDDEEEGLVDPDADLVDESEPEAAAELLPESAPPEDEPDDATGGGGLSEHPDNATLQQQTTPTAAFRDGAESAVDTSATFDASAITEVTEVTEVTVSEDTVTGDDVQITAVTFASPTVLQQSLTTAAPQANAELPLLQRVVVNLLSGLGIGAFASNLPGAPIWSPIVMSLLGLGSRREFSQPFAEFANTATGAPVAALSLTDLAAAAVATAFPGTTRKPVRVSSTTHWIEYVTGRGGLNDTVNRFGIGGTDLGIMWDNGIVDNPATTDVDEHQVLIAFGDTFSNSSPVRTGIWRFNTLFRTPDDKLNDGLYVPDGIPVNAQTLPPHLAHFSGSPMERPNWSDPILPSPGDPVHPPYAIGPEVTIIPTAGVSAPYDNAYGARQYMSFMSIRSWDSSGRWTTNYSGVAYSDDNGQTWEIAPTSIRTAASGRATVPYVSGNENFQQFAFVKPPEGSPEAAEGWVYAYGTPSGRKGTAYLSRVKQDDILDVSKYEYWNGSSWVANDPSAATPVLPTTTTSFFGFFKSTKPTAVSEMSVQYNPYLKKYVMLYGSSSNAIVMRTADSPEGPWSKPKTLVSAWTLWGKYAPYIHPWSGTEYLPESEQHYLYWNLSTWGNYQVRLMRTDLTKIKL